MQLVLAYAIEFRVDLNALRIQIPQFQIAFYLGRCMYAFIGLILCHAISYQCNNCNMGNNKSNHDFWYSPVIRVRTIIIHLIFVHFFLFCSLFISLFHAYLSSDSIAFLIFAGLLFHRGMLLSGTGLSPWSLVSDPAKYAAIISHHANCSPDLQYSQLLKCLRDQPLDVLLSTPIRQPDFGNAFGPSVDGVVIGKFWIFHYFSSKWRRLKGKKKKNKRHSMKSTENLWQ